MVKGKTHEGHTYKQGRHLKDMWWTKMDKSWKKMDTRRTSKDNKLQWSLPGLTFSLFQPLAFVKLNLRIQVVHFRWKTVHFRWETVHFRWEIVNFRWEIISRMDGVDVLDQKSGMTGKWNLKKNSVLLILKVLFLYQNAADFLLSKLLKLRILFNDYWNQTIFQTNCQIKRVPGNMDIVQWRLNQKILNIDNLDII